MNLTVQVKLTPDTSQVSLLKETMAEFNRAANFVSRLAFRYKIFRYIQLYHIKIGGNTMYYILRRKYPTLSAKHIQLTIKKVADAYKARHTRKRNEKKLIESGVKLKRKRKIEKPCSFRLDSAIPFDIINSNIRLMTSSYGNVDNPITNRVRLVTVGGNTKLPYKIGERQRNLLRNAVDARKPGEFRLSCCDNKFYLNIPFEQCVSSMNESPDDYVGVDLGVSNIATTSTGVIYSSDIINTKRTHFKERRKALQKVGTKSAKRALHRNNQKEANFCKNVNHNISYSIVVAAKGTGRGIVVEDLTNIREQTTVRKQQRYHHSSWGFAQLRMMIAYKSALAGVALKIVDPSYTSQRCSMCGHISRLNRKNQFRFNCSNCGHDAHADYNAACNLAQLGKSAEYSYRKVIELSS